MSIAVPRATFQNLTQASQSAPVHQFRCQYTYDLVRKKKRWQDGFCNFHTHNKKVMLYDAQHIVIGGTHWQESDVLQDGDELTLEQHALLLRVDEQIGSTVTDLAPLVEHRAKVQEEKGRQRPDSTALPLRRDALTPGTPVAHVKHKALSSVLQNRRGPIGKAALPESPYQQRYGQQENNEAGERSPKRRRVEDFSITRTVKSVAQKTLKPLAQSHSLRNVLKKKVATGLAPATVAQKQIPVQEVINLVSTSPIPEDDAFIPLTCLEAEETLSRAAAASSPPPPLRPPIRRLDLGKPGVRHTRPVHDETVAHVSTTNDVVEVDNGREKSPAQQPGVPDQQIPKPVNILRIAKSAPRKKLLCQELSRPNAPARSKTNKLDVDVTGRIEQPEEVRNALPKRNERRSMQPLDLNDDRDERNGPEPDSRREVNEENEGYLRARQKIRDARKLLEEKAKNPIDGQNDGRSSSPAFSTLVRKNNSRESSNSRFAKEPREKSQRNSTSRSLRAVEAPIRKVESELTSETMRSDVTIEPTFQPPVDQPESAVPALVRRSSSIRRVQSEADAELAFVSTNAFNISTLDQDDIADPPARKPSMFSSARVASNRNRPPLKRALSDILQKPERSVTRTSANIAKPGPVIPEEEQEIGAWTIEATDFFDWRPPDWEERQNKVKKT